VPGACPSPNACQKLPRATSILALLLFAHARRCYGHGRGPSHALPVVASSYELGILASKRVARCSSESNRALPPVQHSRRFNSRRVLDQCASSRAASCGALRVEWNRTKRVVKLSLPKSP
jgi:hypothetical protein